MTGAGGWSSPSPIVRRKILYFQDSDSLKWLSAGKSGSCSVEMLQEGEESWGMPHESSPSWTHEGVIIMLEQSHEKQTIIKLCGSD